jgi:predicted transcriptional regulator
MTEQKMILDLRATGMTQAEIAARLGCGQPAVCAWESGARGKKRGISGIFLRRLIELHAEIVGSNNGGA